MSELDEIMEGKHEIKHLHIEGDTITFETELNNHIWNLTPRDIEIIIYCLQNQLQQKENIIKEVREKLLCYGETFDLKVHQQMQKELLQILDKEKV